MESVLGHSRKNQDRKKSKNCKKPLEFLDLHFTPGNSAQNEVSPLEILQSCITSIGISFPKPINEPMEIPHNIFWITFRILTLGISTFYFFNNPGTSMSSTLVCLNVYWNKPLKVRRKKKKYIYIYIYIAYIAYVAYIKLMK